MESVNTPKGSSREMQQDQSSRQRRKLTFIITFLVIFSLIIGSIVTVFAIIKHDVEAEGLFANPSQAIRAVCSLTPHTSLCSRSLLEHEQIIHESKRINPSKIFTFSLSVSKKDLNRLISTAQDVISEAKSSKNLAALRDCESLFKDSMRLLNKTMEVMDQRDPDENVFKENKLIIGILQVWMTNATENLDKCSDGIIMEHKRSNATGDKEKVKLRIMKREMDSFCRPSMENSLTILMKMDEILELFDPRFGSALAALLLSTFEYGFSVGVFSAQYLVLIILIVLVLRLY